MSLRSLVCLSASLLSWTLATASASAEEGSLVTMTTKDKRAFLGISVGAAYATVNHPLVVKDGFAAAAIGMHAGYNVSERWSVGIELATVEQGMARQDAYEPFAPLGYVKPQAGCTNCEPPPKGGWVSQTTALFGTLGPRVEFSPMGRDGVYLGVSTGLSMILGIDSQYGVGGGARAGYRLRIANILGLAVEGGFQGQYFSTGTVVFPYAALMMRPYF